MAKFRFGEQIGSGGFGVVSKATRVEDNESFAVKHLSADMMKSDEAVKRFRREVRIQRGLKHPNILPIISANLSAEPPWFVMPIADRSLADVGAANPSTGEVTGLFSAVLAGVEFAHDEQVLHRDIKPENVMIHEGTPKLSDFGLGKNLLADSTDTTRTMIGIGTYPYVAPEQVVDLGAADVRSDVYSLGKLLQFLLTGTVPVTSPKSANVERRFRYFIERCCEDDPADRYQTVRDLEDAFDQVVDGVHRPTVSGDTAAKLIARWTDARDSTAVCQFLELLRDNDSDADLLRRFFPKLDADAVVVAYRHCPRALRHVLDAYDEDVDRPLPFDYCDEVADLYSRLYAATDDLELRKKLLVRLLNVGRTHNRYHVGGVVASLLTQARETSEVMMVADILSDNPVDSSWYKDSPKLRSADLAPPIDEALYG